MNDRDRVRSTVAPDGRPEPEQPRWRRDFPIDWPQDRYISQRDFIKFLLLTSLAFVTGQVWLLLRGLLGGGEARGQRLEIPGAEALPVGGALVFHYPDPRTPCLLVRTGERSFVAYEQLCTHLACPVIPRFADSRLYCPCHDGLFDLATGRPLAGPPRRPLPRIELEARGGRMWAVGVHRRDT